MIAWQSSSHARRPAGRAPARRQAPSTAHMLIVGLFFLIGVTSLAWGTHDGYATYQFLQRSVEVPGKVVRLVPDGNRQQTYSTVVEYSDLRGNKWMLRSSWHSSSPWFYPGEKVNVVYDSTDHDYPPTAKIATFGELWGSLAFYFIFGMSFSGITLAHWIIWRRGN